jgi:hypothetical protein
VTRTREESLIELPIATEVDELAEAAGLGRRQMRDLGGFCQPIRFVAERVA